MNKFQIASLHLSVDESFAATFGATFDGSDGSFEAVYQRSQRATPDEQWTAVHWLGAEREIEHFQAYSRMEAGRVFEELGANAYDDRRLFRGHLTAPEVEAWENANRLANG